MLSLARTGYRIVHVRCYRPFTFLATGNQEREVEGPKGINNDNSELRPFRVRNPPNPYKITMEGPAGGTPTRPYKEELYAARRFAITQPGGGGNPRHTLNWALHELNGVVRGEGIATTVRRKREFIKPTKARNLARMASRKKRFDAHLRDTIVEINDIRRRLS